MAAVVGCSGSTGAGPLTVALGSPRAKAVAALKQDDFCRPAGPPQAIEDYPRCDSPGLQIGEAWVVARYNTDGVLDRVTRYERQPDETRARERWEQLVKAARERYGPESADARSRLAEVAEPPDGTVAWVAFFSDNASTVAALYLVRPATDNDASVVEELRWAVTTE